MIKAWLKFTENNGLATLAIAGESELSDLLRALALPFTLPSLLFVAISSGLLALVLTLPLPLPTAIRALLALVLLWVMLVWLMRYAFRMIDDAANGVREAAVADGDMTSPFGDPRCWVHPVIGVALMTLHTLRPQWPVAPTLLLAALLFPPSIAASAMSGRALDALNPLAIARVIGGLGVWYLPTVIGTMLIAGVLVLFASMLGLRWITIAAGELLLLLTYALIGGAVYLRRIELGFAARISPERAAESAAHERDVRRQHMLDDLYEAVRAHDTPRALADLERWLQGAAVHQLHDDVREVIAAVKQWNEPRQGARLLRALLPVLIRQRQSALAFQAAQAGLALDAGFAPTDEASAVAIVEYAVQTGQRRTGVRLLENFIAALPEGASEQMKALRASLGQVS